MSNRFLHFSGQKPILVAVDKIIAVKPEGTKGCKIYCVDDVWVTVPFTVEQVHDMIRSRPQ